MLLVGNGMMAKAFEKKAVANNILIFASGVSNSTEKNDSEFSRERKLLIDTLEKYNDYYFIYFSTCSIYDGLMKETPYVKHKLQMEDIIINRCKNYLICRVSNVVGFNGNPNTLINFLYKNISDHSKFPAWINSERNIIDVDDLVYYVLELYRLGIKNRIVNIANSCNCKVIEIINCIEDHLGVKSCHEPVDYLNQLRIDTSYLDELNIVKPIGFDNATLYVKRLLKKYF